MCAAPDARPGVGFVRVDVGGAELEVLRGMRSTLATDCPMILCQVLFCSADGDAEETAGAE